LSSGGDVKNKLQLQNLNSVYNGIDVKWNYVQAHKGIEGNEEADTLAKAGAAKFQRKEVPTSPLHISIPHFQSPTNFTKIRNF